MVGTGRRHFDKSRPVILNQFLALQDDSFGFSIELRTNGRSAFLDETFELMCLAIRAHLVPPWWRRLQRLRADRLLELVEAKI